MTIGVLGQGDSLPDQEANDALETLNEIVDKWNTESLMIPFTETYDIILSGKESYTVGKGGDVDIDKPIQGITNARFTVENSNYSNSVTIITRNQFDNISNQNESSSYTNAIYYNNTYPLGTVHVYPVNQKGKLTISTTGQFKVFPSLDYEIDLPAGYLTALKYNLAVQLCLEYGRVIQPQLLELAVGAKTTIKATNSSQKIRTMRSDFAVLNSNLGNGAFNVYSGDF